MNYPQLLGFAEVFLGKNGGRDIHATTLYDGR